MSAASSANLPKTTSMNRAASHNLATPQLSQAHHFFLTIPATTATTCLKQVCKQVQGSVTLQRIMSAPMAYFRSHSWCWNFEKEVTSILWWVDHFTRRLTMQSWQPSTFKFRSVNFWGGIQPVVGSLPGPQTKKAFRLFGEQQPGPPFCATCREKDFTATSHFATGRSQDCSQVTRRKLNIVICSNADNPHYAGVFTSIYILYTVSELHCNESLSLRRTSSTGLLTTSDDTAKNQNIRPCNDVLSKLKCLWAPPSVDKRIQQKLQKKVHALYFRYSPTLFYKMMFPISTTWGGATPALPRILITK